MKRLLFLQKNVCNFFAVFAVGAIRNVHPVVARLGVFLPNKLVKLAMRLDPFEPAFAFLNVAIDAEISGLAAHVLAVRDTADSLIESQAPEAGTNLDWMPHCLPEWLQHLMHKRTQIDDVCLTRIIADAFGRSRGTCRQFLEREVLADIRHHNLNLRCRGQYPVVLR